MPILGVGGNENRRRPRSKYVKNSWRSLFTNGSQRFSSKSHRRDLISSLNLTRLPSESRRIFALVNHRETVRGRLIIDRCGKYMQNAWLRVACSTPCTQSRRKQRFRFTRVVSEKYRNIQSSSLSLVRKMIFTPVPIPYRGFQIALFTLNEGIEWGEESKKTSRRLFPTEETGV